MFRRADPLTSFERCSSGSATFWLALLEDDCKYSLSASSVLNTSIDCGDGWVFSKGFLSAEVSEGLRQFAQASAEKNNSEHLWVNVSPILGGVAHQEKRGQSVWFS